MPSEPDPTVRLAEMAQLLRQFDEYLGMLSYDDLAVNGDLRGDIGYVLEDICEIAVNLSDRAGELAAGDFLGTLKPGRRGRKPPAQRGSQAADAGAPKAKRGGGQRGRRPGAP